MQKLATIERITDILVHPDADAIELAKVQGWQVVVKKGEFSPNDLVIYVEIDTIFNEPPDYVDFLAKNNYRVKTIRLRGEYSQGLILPLSILPKDVEIEEGMIVAEYIGVSKYEKPTGLKGAEIKCSFPSYIGWSKTDEDNICSNLKLLNAIQGLPYYISIKADGSSGSATYEEGEFILASRNNTLATPLNDVDMSAFWKSAKFHNLEYVMQNNPDYGIQFEVVGPGIQKNNISLKQHEIRVFNLYNKINKFYEGYDNLIDFCEKNNIPHVDILEEGECFNYDLEQLKEIALNATYPNRMLAEGIVVRPKTPCRVGQSGLSFKVLNAKYLLKNNE